MKIIDNTINTQRKVEVQNSIRNNLVDFPLYTPSHRINVTFREENIYIGYRTSNNNQTHGTTHFDLQITDNICYLLTIEIEKEKRGRGFGKDLYRTIENIASQQGCTRIELTASGSTSRGESRKEYMLRLGYSELKDLAVYKELGAK